MQSIPPTTADKQTQAQKRRGSRSRKLRSEWPFIIIMIRTAGPSPGLAWYCTIRIHSLKGRMQLRSHFTQMGTLRHTLNPRFFISCFLTHQDITSFAPESWCLIIIIEGIGIAVVRNELKLVHSPQNKSIHVEACRTIPRYCNVI